MVLKERRCNGFVKNIVSTVEGHYLKRNGCWYPKSIASGVGLCAVDLLKASVGIDSKGHEAADHLNSVYKYFYEVPGLGL
jgi:hypothetical protein